MNQLERIQRSLTKKSAPHFEIGDTVKVHVKHLLKKLGLRSRVEAAVWMANKKPEL